MTDVSNAVTCGKNTDDFKTANIQVGFTDPNKNVVTIQYSGANFTCLSGAKALIASASVVVAAALMM